MVQHERRIAIPARQRSRLAALAAAMVVFMVGLVAQANVASAAPVYQITGTWLNQPSVIASGDPVVADWRVNVNDDQPAPGNDPVDNVTATFTLVNSRFEEIPDSCLVDGVTPPSAISTDGITLTCNFGTLDMGTAVALQTPVIADGPTGSSMSGSGSISGLDAPLPQIPIVNPFEMDMAWGTPTNVQVRDPNGQYIDLDFEWTLFHGANSDPGPDPIQFTLRVAAANGTNVNIDPGGACLPFTEGGADGHPWSGGTHPAERMSPFVGTCTLVETATPGVFTLTLSGIDYSQVQVPTGDSAGQSLPTDLVAVASGSVWFRAFTTTNTSVALSMDPITYTSTTSLPSIDNTANNTSNKPIEFAGPGGVAQVFWNRGATGSGGTAWDDTYRVSPGTTLWHQSNVFWNNDPAPLNAPYGNCLTFDTEHVSFTGDFPGISSGGRPDNPDLRPYPIEYYTGPYPQADPRTFNCGGTTGWSTTPPADPADVSAVRVLYPFSAIAGKVFGVTWVAEVEVHGDVPIGQDVWATGQSLRNGTWLTPLNYTTGGGTPTPNAQYTQTTNMQDIVRIITALPNIDKEATETVVTPGVPAEFTLIYSANGSGVIPPTVDDYVIRDVLPLDMTYVGGSTRPTPLIPEPTVSTNGAGQQVLTWSLDDVATNTLNELTYQAVADSDVAPGTRLVNTATSSFAGQTSRPATEAVTTSVNGYTTILKTEDMTYIPNPTGAGDGSGSWTVTVASFDPLPQAYTDTIDILPFIGDGRGTDYNGTYALDEVVLHDGGTVYYTDFDYTSLTAAELEAADDPATNGIGGVNNGAPNAPAPAMWSTTRPTNVTAVRVIGAELPAGDTFTFQVLIDTAGAIGGDVYVNRAQARAEHTTLVMRTSAPLIVANFYDYTIKKYVQDTNGVWHDAQDPADYPTFDVGDTVTYRIQVTNTGQGTLEDLVIDDDVFDQGSFVIDTLPAVAPGNVVTHEFSIVADESLLGTTVNTVCATVTTTPPDVDEPPEDKCDPAGILVFDVDFDKVMVGKVPNGDGTYTITYDVLAIQEGDGGPAYTVTDTLTYGASATIVSTSVTNTSPGGIPTNPAWNGTTDVTVATGVPFAGGQTHVYRVTVVAQIDEPATTAAMSDCDMGGDAGTGFFNTAQMTAGTRVFTDDACVEYPAPVITKTIASGPTDLGNGQYRVTYNITATNNGVDPTTYNLDDTLKYGNGITIVSTSVANSAPGGIATSGSWNGTGDIRVATDVPIGGVTAHTYTASVIFTVAGGISAEALNCTFAGGEAGTGLFNTATLTNNGETRTADACAVPPQPPPPSPPTPTVPPTMPDTGQLPATGGNGTPIMTVALLLIGLGAIGVLVKRRHLRRRPTLG